MYLNRPGYCAGCDVLWLSRGRVVGICHSTDSQVRSVSYSIRVIISITEWRRWRLWKIPRYSKMALANSIWVRQGFRLRTSTWSRAQKDLMMALLKQMLIPPAVDRRCSHPQTFSDLGHRHAGLDQIDHMVAVLGRIEPRHLNASLQSGSMTHSNKPTPPDPTNVTWRRYCFSVPSVQERRGVAR